MTRRPPSSPPFPYTPLSRAELAAQGEEAAASRAEAYEEILREPAAGRQPQAQAQAEPDPSWQAGDAVSEAGQAAADIELERSEEHTSEPQSPCNLVCRLLLE